MGLFSSSYKYYAYAGTSSLLPADQREHTVKSLMLQAAISGSSTLAEAVKMGLQTDLYRRAMKQAKYAAKPDGYPYGFPSVSNTTYNITTTMLRPYIEAEIGTTIDFRTMHWGNFSNIDRRNFWLEKAISDNYLNTSYFPWPAAIGDPVDTNWSPVDDTVEIPIENPVPGGTYWESNNQFEADIVGETYHVRFPYDVDSWWHVAQGFDLGAYNNGEDWIQVRYRETGGGDQYKYWTYQIGSNAIPALDAEIVKAQFEGEYLPIAVLMHDTTWFDELVPENLVLEKGLDKLLKYISMDPWDVKNDFIDSIVNPDPETPPDQIPNIDDIWDFFVHFSMPLRTTDRAAREYLWRFYKQLATRTWTTFDDYNTWVTTRFGDQPQTQFSVEEGEEYTGYIARYAWSYISEATFSGEYTPPGWTRPLKTRECWSEEYQLTDPDYNVGLDLVHGVGNYNVASGQADGEEHTYTIVVRQNKLSEGAGLPTYTAVLMMGPSMEYQINTSEDPVGVGSTGYVDYRYRFVDCELFPDDPEEDSEFRWPVNIGVLKDMSAMRREPALQEALAATVFLVDRVKVKWYQKGFFKWLIIIIVIIVIIITYQYELLGTVASMASTAFAAGATATAIAFAALYVTMVFALGFLISFAGSLIGGTWGQIFVILATIYLAGGTAFLSNIGQAWGSMVTNFGWATATSFLQAIGPVVQIGQLIIEDRALAKLEDDMRDFTKTAREKYEVLQDAWDELGEKPSWLDPLDLVGAFKAQWYVESPDTYFQRTLNANPGVLGYDAVNRFTELALHLPMDGNPAEYIGGMLTEMAKQRGAV